MDKYKEISQVNAIILILNLLVAAGKIAMGYAIKSMSMVADGFHSITDASSNIVGLVGIKFSYRPEDQGHPYGHRKIETVITLAIALMLFLTCYEIIKTAAERISKPFSVDANIYSFAVMIATMGINVFISTFERRKGHELHSDFLVSDSMHTTSDIYVSASVLLSLIFARLGIHWADIVVSLFIVFMIGRAGYEILSNGLKVLLDAAALDSDKIASLVNSIDGVKSCHKIRTRGHQDNISVDLHVLVDKDMHVSDAHQLTDVIENRLKKSFSGISDVTIHIEPESSEKGR